MRVEEAEGEEEVSFALPYCIYYENGGLQLPYSCVTKYRYGRINRIAYEDTYAAVTVVGSIIRTGNFLPINKEVNVAIIRHNGNHIGLIQAGSNVCAVTLW